MLYKFPRTRNKVGKWTRGLDMSVAATPQPTYNTTKILQQSERTTIVGDIICLWRGGLQGTTVKGNNCTDEITAGDIPNNRKLYIML